MELLADREFNLEGWGGDKRLIEGPCGHCHHAVAFKDPASRACLAFSQVIHNGQDSEEHLCETHASPSYAGQMASKEAG